MCLPLRKRLSPHLPKAKIPLCHSQAFSQRGATTWQLLLQVSLWPRFPRVLTQQNEEVAPSQGDLCQCLSIPAVSAHPRWCRGFSQEGTAEAQQKKNLWSMVWLWLLLPNYIRSSEYSIPILSYLTGFETSSLLPSFSYTSSFRASCCNLSLVFLSAEFWGKEVMWVFLLKRQQGWSYTLCHKASPSPQKEKGNFCFTVHHTVIYITNNICMQDGKISSIWNEQGNFLCTSVFTYRST